MAATLAAACAVAIPRADVSSTAGRAATAGRIVRVALSTDAQSVTLSAAADWRLDDSDGRSTLVRARGGDTWTVTPLGTRLRAVRSDGVMTATRPGPLVARAVESLAPITVNGKRYRGEVLVHAHARGLTVVNRLPVEEYLRGVVPLEIGERTPAETAAVRAQAVAARSYTYVRLKSDATSAYDLLASVMDQAYGGVDAERPLTDAGVRSTAGLVLTYAGRVVNAPYHSTCGGSTASAAELWQRTPDEPYLVPISDRIAGTDRAFCDASPRYRWTQEFDRAQLARSLERYLSAYEPVPRGGPGVPRAVQVVGHTRSGRAKSVVVATTRGRFTLLGNEIRFVMRTPGGEILNSTYFSVRSEQASDGTLSRLILSGVGYGHGVGMCQWGAIGRARAGQDFREILRTYYPGTRLATAE